jgi:hypothetical protein
MEHQIALRAIRAMHGPHSGRVANVFALSSHGMQPLLLNRALSELSSFSRDAVDPEEHAAFGNVPLSWAIDRCTCRKDTGASFPDRCASAVRVRAITFDDRQMLWTMWKAPHALVTRGLSCDSELCSPGRGAAGRQGILLCARFGHMQDVVDTKGLRVMALQFLSISSRCWTNQLADFAAESAHVMLMTRTVLA